LQLAAEERGNDWSRPVAGRSSTAGIAGSCRRRVTGRAAVSVLEGDGQRQGAAYGHGGGPRH